MGDAAQGVVLPGQPRAVKEGNGITISADGTIEIDSQTIVGVIRLGQTQAWSDSAFNAYYWPLAVGGGDVGKQLTITSVDGSGDAFMEWADSDGIDWTARGQLIAGTGLGETNDILVNIGTDRSFLMSQVGTPASLSGLAYSDVVTSSMKLPVGTNLERPLTPSVGEFRFNSTSGKLEVYISGAWQDVASSDPLSGSFVVQTAPTVPVGATPSAVFPVGTTAQRQTTPAPAQGYARFNTDTDKLEVYALGSWEQIASSDPVSGSFVVQTAPTGPVGATPSAVFPVGTTAQRQTTPVPASGYARFNTDTTLMEVFNGTLWVPIGAPPSIGLGLNISGIVPSQVLKVSIPQQDAPPVPGTLANEAVVGSMYWDDVTGQLYIYYSNGGTPAWVQAASSATGASVTSFSGGTTGLTPASPNSGNVTLGGVLNVANGGTGATTQAAAAAAVLPSQAGNAGTYLTTDGTVTSWGPVVSIPSGTTMLFAQAAAPTGWVQVTTATYNDAAIRLVTSAGAGTGGTIGFTTLFSPTSSYSGSITITSGTVGDTTLSVAQLASHSHSYTSSSPAAGGPHSGGPAPTSSTFTTGGAGGNAVHTHSLSGVNASGNFTSNFAVKYVNMIVASKT